MHHTSPMKNGLGFMPSMYSFTDLTSLPEMVLDFGLPSTSDHVQKETLSKTSWEKRCLRKHKRRADDDGCSAKRRRLMADAGSDSLGDGTPSTGHTWPPANGSLPLSPPASTAAQLEPCHSSEDLAKASSALSHPETEASCMEIEAAHRRLREIEDRIQVDDDDEDEDLDVEPELRRPVLVLSDSLKEGLKRGISDILPPTLAQSVSHSCMELVVWRPPGDALSQRLKDSLLRQRKQQTPCRQPPTPCPSPLPHSPLSPTSPPPPGDGYSPLYSFPVEHSSGEEDMEL